MQKFLAILTKEFLLLWRDKVGLLVLFVLPTILVLFISLIQPNDSLKAQHIRISVFDQDQATLGHAINKALHGLDTLKVHSIASRSNARLQAAKRQVLTGQQQALIVIPRHLSSKHQSYVRALYNPAAPVKKLTSTIQIYADAALSPAISQQIKITIQMMLQKLQLKLLTSTIRQQVTRGHSHLAPDDFLSSRMQYLQGNQHNKKANIAQQNVPAWSLFGMFFIVIPLASVMIRERVQGIGQRLFLTPASYLLLFSSRFVAFASLNLLQLLLMLAIGVYILPLFGIVKLALLPHIVPVLGTGLCAACAATGFGILLGTLLRTQQQASFLGPFIVIIAAAIGGIFVPVDVMPAILLKVVHYSPLYWAQSTFLDIFVRNSTLHDPSIIKQLIKLIGFAICCVLLGTLLGKLRKPQTRIME